MNKKLALILGVLLIVGGIVASSALFTVHETKQAIVLQFGNPKVVYSEPGLKAKLPFIQDVEYYEKRVLNLDAPVERVLLADQKPLEVDAFARYRITDPLRFRQSVSSEFDLTSKVGQIMNATLRDELGNVTLASVLSEERTQIMTRIQQRVSTQARRFGINLVDVRIRASDLPDEISQAVYDRMKSEREREAAEFRAQGFELGQRIRASADREATVIRAEAKREADILRGQGEAERTRLLNAAYGKDPEFFEFYRSMTAYEDALRSDNTTYVLTPEEMEFFNFFGSGVKLNERDAEE